MFDWYEYIDEKKCKVIALEFIDFCLVSWHMYKRKKKVQRI
jgi:hypothetical protein